MNRQEQYKWFTAWAVLGIAFISFLMWLRFREAPASLIVRKEILTGWAEVLKGISSILISEGTALMGIGWFMLLVFCGLSLLRATVAVSRVIEGLQGRTQHYASDVSASLPAAGHSPPLIYRAHPQSRVAERLEEMGYIAQPIIGNSGADPVSVDLSDYDEEPEAINGSSLGKSGITNSIRKDAKNSASTTKRKPVRPVIV